MKNTPRHQSVMKHSFSDLPDVNVRRSVFDRSAGHKTTFDAGQLIPIYVDEILPGDSVRLGASLLARLATPLYPVMDNMFLETHFFFVPYRLLWDNWERFNGAQDNPGDSVDYLVPQLVASTGFPAGTLADYFGIPTSDLTSNTISVNALPFRAYRLVYNEWFRHQDLQDSLDIDFDDGPDSPISSNQILRRNKRHDYFTSCLPFPQKGPAVSIPLGDIAPVVSNAADIELSTSSVTDSSFRAVAVTGQTNINPAPSGSQNLQFGSETGLEADLSNATAATINSLRLAFQTQKYYERNARSGTRYVESLFAHFGVVNPDFRLQRPEYLGGGSQRMIFNTVANTASDTGDLGAFGLSVGSRHGFSKSFTEHGVLIGLVSARADLTYQTGIPRMFSRSTLFDFAFPVFAHVGEQAVLNKELYFQGTAADDDVFGYQERYAEYRYQPSKITGLFRSVHPQSLDAWHLSQDFVSLPPLNASFMQDDPPVDRVIKVPSEPHFILDAYFSVRHARPLPVRSVPGYIDHF